MTLPWLATASMFQMPGVSRVGGWLAQTEVCSGRHLKSAIRTNRRYVPPYAIAFVRAGLGERDAVFEWLNRAYGARDVHLMFLTVDPKMGPLPGGFPFSGSEVAPVSWTLTPLG
jgi:hypothetical protein